MTFGISFACRLSVQRLYEYSTEEKPRRERGHLDRKGCGQDVRAPGNSVKILQVMCHITCGCISDGSTALKHGKILFIIDLSRPKFARYATIMGR